MISGPQAHLLLNHFPIVGFVLLTPVLLLALLSKSTDRKRLALLGAVVIGLLAAPAYLTGEPAEEGIEHMPGVAEAQIEEHEESAELALVLALVTAGIAAVTWYASRRSDKALALGLPATALASVVTTGVIAYAAHEGGKIRHPELSGEVQGSETPDSSTESIPDESGREAGEEAGEDEDDRD